MLFKELNPKGLNVIKVNHRPVGTTNSVGTLRDGTDTPAAGKAPKKTYGVFLFVCLFVSEFRILRCFLFIVVHQFHMPQLLPQDKF